MVTKTVKFLFFKVLTLVLLFSCITEQNKVSINSEFNIEYETFTLDNGLKVIFHIDRSDPVAAVILTTHVGSAREVEGRTGIAHLFEHLLFQNSENLGKGGLDKLSKRIGGSGANGSTRRDRTIYHQTVPNDALEKMIWAEAEKLGFFINTVTDPVLEKEKQVVKNEKRQMYDNRPYGYITYIIDKHIYPKEHPYNWQPIGSLKDVQNATLQDVKDFYNRLYSPNNSTLTISGDFDIKQTKQWVNKYFGEIKRGEEVPKMEKQPVKLEQNKRIFYEDNFAKTPQLILTWPGVYRYHPDSYALEVLGKYLSETGSPLYQLLIKENKQTASVGIYQKTWEIAGQFMILAEGFSDTKLQDIYDTIEKAFVKFEVEGIKQSDLDRIKAIQETNFYNSLSSVLSKGIELAEFEMHTGDPGFINQYVKNMLAVTTEDVMRVYDKYIKNKNFVATSFVPKDKKELALIDSKQVEVVEEKIVKGKEKLFNVNTITEYKKTPSSFDRSIEPPYGPTPYVKTPQVWRDELSSGLKFFGIENNEVPLVQFQLQIKGGMQLESQDKIGVSNLLANLLIKGTKTKTAKEFKNALEQLGSSIDVEASKELISIYGVSMTKHFEETIALLKEMLLEPRWDTSEFEIIKKNVLSQINSKNGEPEHIAENKFNKLIYGENHIFSNAISGTNNSLTDVNMNDLKSYYNQNFSPNITNVHIVGAISKEAVINSFSELNSNWKSKQVIFPDIKMPELQDSSSVYFYDVPGAKQSILRFGHPSVALTSPDYYPLTIYNYSLRNALQKKLRNEKGYTYNIKSQFTGSNNRGLFDIKSSVRSNITYEAVSLVREILKSYGNSYNEVELETTKNYMIKSNARALERMSSKISYLLGLSYYGFDDDFITQRQSILENLTVDDIKALSKKHIQPNRMLYLIIGDAAKQLKEMERLGIGKPISLND